MGLALDTPYEQPVRTQPVENPCAPVEPLPSAKPSKIRQQKALRSVSGIPCEPQRKDAGGRAENEGWPTRLTGALAAKYNVSAMESDRFSVNLKSLVQFAF